MHSREPSGLLPLRPLTSRFTSAMPVGWRDWLPLKMTSSMDAPRRLLALCSPRTQEMASEMLLLPQPLGPTMPVTPPLKSSSCRSQKDLNPTISTLSSRMKTPRYCESAGTVTQGIAGVKKFAEIAVPAELTGKRGPRAARIRHAPTDGGRAAPNGRSGVGDGGRAASLRHRGAPGRAAPGIQGDPGACGQGPADGGDDPGQRPRALPHGERDQGRGDGRGVPAD